jgi:glycosyltransferase involved in cell wall biosynthesis
MKLSSPEVSVVIPTRDRPQYLQQAIASVLSQQGVSLELIIVNDGARMVPPHPDPRVRVLDNQQRGAVPARNLGVAAASGNYIAFLDDDDWWADSQHLAISLAAGADFSFADGEFVFMDGSPPVEFAFDASAASLASDNTILISGVCYAKRLHSKLGPFDETLPYYWDWDWYLRVARSGTSLIRIPVGSVCIRVHSNNMSGDEQEEARRGNLQALAEKHRLGHLELKNHLGLVRHGAPSN